MNFACEIFILCLIVRYSMKRKFDPFDIFFTICPYRTLSPSRPDWVVNAGRTSLCGPRYLRSSRTSVEDTCLALYSISVGYVDGDWSAAAMSSYQKPQV